MIRSSFAGFTTAQLGMSAANSALNVIGQNISNINVTGYTRQRVDLDSFNVTTGPRQWGSVNETFIGNGVVTNRIEQVRDPYLDLRFRTEMSSVGYYDKMLVSLEDLQSVLDEVDREGSIHNQLEAVFKALNEFNPQAANNEFQNMAKTEMQLLTQYFNNYSNRIQQAKDDNLKEFKEQTIPELNQLLKDITNLNRSIKDNEILGNPALELRDERNLLLDELSQYVKIEVTYENKYLGLSDRTAEECTVKILGIDDKGNNFKYTIIDDDKASQFQINDDCSNLTMTDVDGNPIADIGSALKSQGANPTTPAFTKEDAEAATNILKVIQNLSDRIKDQMNKINDQNQKISNLSSQKNSLVKQGNQLHDDLYSALSSVKSINNVIDSLTEQIGKIDQTTENGKKKAEALQAQIDSRKELLKKYYKKLYGQETLPKGLDENPPTLDGLNGINDTNPDGSLVGPSDGTGIYNKLIKIYGPITDVKSQPPKYDPNPADDKKGELALKKEELADARADLKDLQSEYTLMIKTLKAFIYGGTSDEVVTKDKDGKPIQLTDKDGKPIQLELGLKDENGNTIELKDIDGNPINNITIENLEKIAGLAKYANITVDWESYPVDGTDFFVSLPTITLAGTSARDGNGIPLFDADTGKVGKIESDGKDITITDTRGVTYNEKVADVDGSPYQLELINGKWEVKKDEYGNPILDMGDQTNMYERFQEDSGSLKASLDMFNRAGEFNETSDRGYDYYLNMLDAFARQIAKVFNEANTMDKDGNPLVDEDGKPLDYANALFGADGKAPQKNINVTNAKGQYLGYDGKFHDEPMPDVFKTDKEGYVLDDKGNRIPFPANSTDKFLSLNAVYQVNADGYLVDKNGNVVKDDKDNPVTPKNFSDALEKAALDTTSLAAYGIVKSPGSYALKDNTAPNTIKAIWNDETQQWIDESNNVLAKRGENGTWVDNDGNLVAKQSNAKTFVKADGTITATKDKDGNLSVPGDGFGSIAPDKDGTWTSTDGLTQYKEVGGNLVKYTRTNKNDDFTEDTTFSAEWDGTKIWLDASDNRIATQKKDGSLTIGDPAISVSKSSDDIWVDGKDNFVCAGDITKDDDKATPPHTNKTNVLNGIAANKYDLLAGKVPKIDYDQITADNFTITQDWVDSKTNFVQTHDPSQTAGYNDNINHLISQFSEKLDYTFTLPDGTQQKVFNGTFVEFYDNIGNQLGLDIKSSTVLENNYITVANDIANNRDAISGVSLDEEGIDILRYQKAYSASARLMTALDEQLDKVINNMGIVGR